MKSEESKKTFLTKTGVQRPIVTYQDTLDYLEIDGNAFKYIADSQCEVQMNLENVLYSCELLI